MGRSTRQSGFTQYFGSTHCSRCTFNSARPFKEVGLGLRERGLETIAVRRGADSDAEQHSQCLAARSSIMVERIELGKYTGWSKHAYHKVHQLLAQTRMEHC